MSKQSKRDILKTQWMLEYETRVTETIPALTGHIDWDTATYLYNIGISAKEAARRTIQRHFTGELT